MMAPAWGRNYSPLNKCVHKSLLVVIGDFLDLCDWYNIGDVRYTKAVPLQAWNGPEGSRKLRFVDFMTTAQDGGKVVSLTHRPPLPMKCSWYSFLLEAESISGP